MPLPRDPSHIDEQDVTRKYLLGSQGNFLPVSNIKGPRTSDRKEEFLG